MHLAGLLDLGERIGERLVARGETIVVSESSAGGLISAALLARAGASQYYLGGAVVYTRRAFRRFTTLTAGDMAGLRSSTVPYAQLMAQHQRERFRASWCVAETGAAGPAGNPYGDPAGHSCVAVVGAVCLDRVVRTGADERVPNMVTFAMSALTLLDEAIAAAASPSR